MADADGVLRPAATETFGVSGATEDLPGSHDIEVSAGPVIEDAVVLRVAGEVDVLTAPILAGHVERHFAERGAGDRRVLVLDLTGVTFLASAGLAVFVNAKTLAARHQVDVRLVATSRIVLRPLALTGIDKALTVAPDLASAMAVRD